MVLEADDNQETLELGARKLDKNPIGLHTQE